MNVPICGERGKLFSSVATPDSATLTEIQYELRYYLNKTEARKQGTGYICMTSYDSHARALLNA